MSIASYGLLKTSATDPTATPPAKVALRISSISNLPNIDLAVKAAPRQLPLIPKTVLTITLYC